ncbi:MAG: sigma-70 family RNA polymerase sigma factor [Polyangiales bacterium]
MASKVQGVQPEKSAGNRVVELPIAETDAALVAALRANRAEAGKTLFKRYGRDVERVLFRVLGPDVELADLLHDVFVAALTSIDQVRDPNALRGWLTGIAVRKARKCIVKRRRWRIIQFFAPMDMPEAEARVTPTEVSEALRCTYEVLNKLPADERLAFALRHIDGMELTAVAAACGCSLATIKRRLTRAHANFVSLASTHSALAEWLERGELGR